MAEENINLTIDGIPISVPKGTTILDAAREAGIEIPVLCYSEVTTPKGLCRLCVVDVEDRRGLSASCVTEVAEGIDVKTNSEEVIRARRTILEMLASTVDLSEAPSLQDLIVQYDAQPERFEGGSVRQPEIIDDNPVYIRDYAQCVMCWRCVQVCAEDAQYTYALNFGGRGFNSHITTYFEKGMPDTTCVFCGQCVGVCPTGALKGKREFLLEQGIAPEQVLEITRIQGLGKASKGGPHLDRINGGTHVES